MKAARMGKISGLLALLASILFLVGTSQDDGSLQQRRLEEEEEEEPVQSAIILVIVLVLILMTIVFELMKEHIEEHAARNFKPIIEALFGELTILGFLSCTVFCITQTGYFSILSEKIYGDAAELLEVLEQVHYSIFFIMVFFVLQVLVLVAGAMETEEQWLAADRQCRTASDEWTAAVLARKQARPMWKSLLQLIVRNKQQEQEEDVLLFKAIRQEFLLDRSLEPPFAPCPESIPDDFNFGRYLSVCLGSTLTHTVKVSVSTWIFFAFGTLLYAGLHFALDSTALVWTWVAAGWAFFIFEEAFEWHLLSIRDMFAAIPAASVDATDTTPLNQAANETLPPWTRVNLLDYNRKRPWFIQYCVGGTPNRQHTLYWADRKGPTFYLLILQIKLIFVGLYMSVHFLEFVHHMRAEHSLQIFAMYIVLSLLPVLGIVFSEQHLVATLSQVCCLGTYRRPQVIAAVLRENKTAAAVRSFICIYKLRKFAADAADPHEHHSSEEQGSHLHHSASFTELEKVEISKCFDSFDRDGSGSITIDEIHDMMLALGAPMLPSTLRAILSRLDTDGDEQISRDEFLAWYAHDMTEPDHLSEHERAKFLFSLFDQNGSGEVSVGECKQKLDSLNVGFTVDDVAAIVNELDEDNSGSIGLHEFQHLLHRYYPRELMGDGSEPTTHSHGASSGHGHHHA